MTTAVPLKKQKDCSQKDVGVYPLGAIVTVAMATSSDQKKMRTKLTRLFGNEERGKLTFLRRWYHDYGKIRRNNSPKGRINAAVGSISVMVASVSLKKQNNSEESPEGFNEENAVPTVGRGIADIA